MRGQKTELLGSSINSYPLNLEGTGDNFSLQLRLLHHYLTSTCAQLPGGNTRDGFHLWAVIVPQMAFSCDYLLNALLGLSAQHMWALNCKEKSLATMSRRYLAKAIASHRKELHQASSTNAEYLQATSILITHHTWVASHSVSINEPYILPLQTYHLARSLQCVTMNMFPWLLNSKLLWYTELQSITARNGPCPQVINHELHELFQALGVTGSPENRVVYGTALRELASLYSAIARHVEPDILQCTAATMVLRLSPHFLTLLEEHDPTALALFALNIAFLKFIDDAWWLHGKNEHLVVEHSIQGITRLMPESWLWALEWPSKVVRGEIRRDDLL